MLYARMAPSWYLWQVSSILLLTAVVCVMSRIRGHLSNEAKLSIDNFKKEVTGIVELYKSISLNELASKIGMKPDETERFLALMAAEGTFNGTIRDGFVFLSTEEPEKLTEKSEEQIGSTQVISEKLRKLEELYKEGKISEYAYKKLKEEYEREK